MNCDEATEFVSALHDGEKIPREAAEHFGVCTTCKALLAEFAEMGAELRCTASLDTPGEIVAPLWDKPQWTLTGWWQKGWQMMRIPRFAFAFLLVGLAVLGSSLALVEVRAHDEGSVVKLAIDSGTEQPMQCLLSTVDKSHATCASIGHVQAGMLSYEIKLLQKAGGRVQLGVRSKVETANVGSHSYSLSALNSEPENEYWFEPGQSLKIPISGFGDLTVTGEWTDHIPSFLSVNQSLDPAPKALQISSPLLLCDKRVVGDLEGGTAAVDKLHQGIQIYMPGVGRFRIFLESVAGAVAAHVELNRLSFESDGKIYTFITGTPIARAKTVWVLYDADLKPEGGKFVDAYIGSTEMPGLPRENPAP